ncbi:MAG: phosphate ABC transporter substrate-binding protein PstS [Actinomycetota bacterium]
MPRRKPVTTLSVCLVGVFVLAACSSDNSSSTTSGGGGGSSFDGVALTGAGATFPDPIYEQWFKDFHSVESGADINYQAIGSGGGVEQLTKQTVDFGASDAPLQKDQVKALPGDVVQIPTVLGGVVFGYNVPGLGTGLRLDGTTAADVFLGTITNWNDPALAKLNPDMSLPDMPIQVVHRSDESGTTFVFTSWLAAESSDWQKQVGADTAVQWPTGSGADGNDGVAAGISQTKGAIGYVSYDFAVASHLGIAQVKRDDGTYVTPTVQSITAAGGILKFPIAPDTNILNSSATGAYPISTTTYLLIYSNQTDTDKGQTIVDFVHWALTDGQPTTTKLNYAPLPPDIAQRALQQLSNVKYQGQTITPSGM